MVDSETRTEKLFELWDRTVPPDGVDLAQTLGIRPLYASESEVHMIMDWRPEIAQPTGVFAAGSLIQLGDVANSMLGLLNLQDSDQSQFPLAVQLSTNLIGNTTGKSVVAVARILSSGRTVLSAQSEISPVNGASIAFVTGTYLYRPRHRAL
ncbi:PaaI family thioesterase [Nocardia sp. CA-120079]|uniref:PaaI family thioesterase n=1 Tax=Nocardia sp. CA-120079 TaxID=3239974 RepID=UPI003D99F709